MTSKYNESYIPKNRLIHTLLSNKLYIKDTLKKFMPKNKIDNFKTYIKAKNKKIPLMKKDTEQYLKHLYKDDIIKLQNLIKKDLSIWLK
jgi:hypothetical protein